LIRCTAPVDVCCVFSISHLNPLHPRLHPHPTNNLGRRPQSSRNLPRNRLPKLPPQCPRSNQRTIRKLCVPLNIYAFLAPLTLSLKDSAAVVPGRQGQRTLSTASGPVQSQTPQNRVGSTQVFRQSTPSTLVSVSRTKSQVSNSDNSMSPHVRNSKNTPTSVPARPQTVNSSTVAISADTQNNVGKAPMHESPSSPSTSGKSLSSTREESGKRTSSSLSSTTIVSNKNGGRGMKVLYTIYLGCSDHLTGYPMNRLRVWQPKQIFHRKEFL
jgi:hypothetical protein